MKTSSNNNNIESKNRVINYDIEIVRDFDGTYYVNARNELHEHIKGLPEYLPYKELKKAVKEALGVTLPPLKSLTFEGNGRKQYADAYGLQGVEIHQEPLAFGLQDKVILGSFGESRPYAISCTVTGYRWDSEAGEFLYILQGEDGKEYTDFARNIIHDPKGGEKATLEPASEITDGTEVWTTMELHEEYGKRGKVVRRFFADHGVWCLDIEFEDGTKATYAEEYVTTEKPWAVVGAKCKHKYLNRDVVLTITAVGQYYGIKAESEDGKVKRCGLARDFEPLPTGTDDDTLETSSEITEQREQNDAGISSAESRRDKANGQITEAEGIKVGDRVWCKHGKVMGTVTAIRIWNPDYAFKVRLDKPVTLFGRTFEETEFRRAGITKNYDRDGMIVGNATYYAEQLKYGPASIIEYEFAGVALRTESTREDVEPDSREGWGNEYRVTIHHKTGGTTETMTLSETAELLARMYQEEQGKAA